MRCQSVPQFDEVHVISDLHMGGKEGFQILRATARLQGYIEHLSEQNPLETLALVLNGDIFDTLAEDGGGYIALENAVDVVSGIMQREPFNGIWSALSKFVSCEGRTLVFVIGNHDIEIAFPSVQNYILCELAGTDLAKRARIQFSTIGAGFTCLVGESKVYCTHGNEVDAWNYNRYEELARASRRINAGDRLDPCAWIPNAGTRMVKDLMNEIKKKYRWIDLLKPETSAAFGTLLALDPAQTKKFGQLLPILKDTAIGTVQVDKRLSAPSSTEPADEFLPVEFTPDALIGDSLFEEIRRQQSVDSGIDVDNMLLEAEANLGKPEKLIAPEQKLGTPELIWDRLTGWITGVSKQEALRKALVDWLKEDKSFDIDNRDTTFKKVCDRVGNSVHFIVTGHTHLERAIELGEGRFYFNTGTWVRLLRLTPAMLKDTDTFSPVYKALENGSMESIEAASIPNGDQSPISLVLDQTSAVIIKKEGAQVVGELVHVEGESTVSLALIRRFGRN